MKHKWLFNAMAVLFLVTSLFGSFANTPVAVAATGESSTTDKIEPALLDQFSLEGMADFTIRFNEQADLSPAYQMGWAERGEFVYNTLRETAARTQAYAKGMLDAAGLEYQTFIAGNDLYVKGGTLELATALAALDEVYYIRAERTYYIDPVIIENPLANVSWSGDLLARNLSANVGNPEALAWGITNTKADQFWTAFSVQGDGIKVANIDTGVQYNHPALDQAFACASPSDPACWADPSNICGGSACDNNGHGTHTMGTMVGDDDPALTWQAGMAPNATWIACKGCESSSCSTNALNACADWILAPGGSSANRPDVVNNSWGGGSGDPWYLAKVNAWRAAGTYPAFSAGNSGSSCNTLGSPGDYQESFASAAHDSGGTIASFSSRGPSAFGHDPYTKPNISAPGVSVCSSVPTNSWSCGYSGTSMASPHSAGAVALLWSCNPALIGQIDITFEALQNAAAAAPAGNCGVPPDGQGNYTYGYGYLDVLAAGVGVCGGIDTGHINGHVYDAGGVTPIEGATVTAAPGLEGAGIDAITDPNGYYTMTVVVGTYDVTASMVGYQSQTVSGVVVVTDTTETVDFNLPYLGAWTLVDPPPPGCPDWTRYDGEYFAGDGMVYFMGGRSGTDTFPDIYRLDLSAGSCSDTGANMVTGISNYQIVPLNIGGTDMLCTFGGRNPAGGQTDDVQCYDPVANTVTVVDDLPPSYTGFGPAAAVAVNNKAYVFGGFNSLSAPYETNDTWEWDPNVGGGTWTQKDDLVQALGYIQATVVDGLIYGFGGTVFDGTNLNAQTMAQVYDPVADTWTAITPLPTAGAEGRAYGFDSGSGYELAGQIVVAGGGQWPAETPEAFLYDIATDSYDYSFPDLNITRRDHAGVFVPEDPGVPDDPGTMWVFGGRSGSDTPPYNTFPEYYEVTVTGGTPDLEIAPASFESTQFADEVVTQTLTISNVGTADLDWLLYDNGTTGGGILVDWADNFDSYAPDSSMHGQGGWKGWFNDPAATAYVRNTLSHSPSNSVEVAGPTDLVHQYSGYTSGTWIYRAWQYVPGDFSGATYFILMNQYDDAGMNLNWSTQVQFNSTTGTVINTGFTGGTLPLIYDQWVELRVDIDLVNDIQRFYYDGALLYEATWTEEQSIVPGILNIAAVDLFANNASEVYYDDVSLTAPAACDYAGDIPWLSVNPESGTTPAGGSEDVSVFFDSTGVTPGVYSDFLCAESNDPVTPIVSIPVTLTVEAYVAGVTLTPDTDADAGDPGSTVVYTLTLENTGNLADTFTIESAGVWDVTLPITSTSLAPGETADVTVQVTVPADALAGDSDVTTVTATSEFDDTVSDTSVLTTTANQIYGFELAPATAALSGAPGDVVTYTLTLTNVGNGEDTYAVTFTLDAWEVTLPVSSFDLAAGETVDFIVLVTVAPGAGDGDTDIVTITVTSDGDGSEAESVLTTTAVVIIPEGFITFLPITFKN